MTEQLPIGDQIRQARLAMRLNQGELARLCGFGQTRISVLERGEHRIREVSIKKLEDVLGVKLNPAEFEIVTERQKLTFTDLEYDLLKSKIGNLKPDEAISLPGTARLAQLIRMNLRRDRPSNSELPIVSVIHSRENNEISIHHRREILRGADMKVSKIDVKEIPTRKNTNYQELIDQAKKVSDGQAIKVEFDDETKASRAYSAVYGYRVRGTISSAIQVKRKGSTLYLFK